MNRFNWGLLRFCQIRARGKWHGAERENFRDGICQHPQVRPCLFMRTKEAT